MFQPAQRSVGMADMNVVVAEVAQHLSCLFSQWPMAFNCVNLAGDLGEYSSRIAGSRSNLEYALSTREPQGLCHDRDDVGLRDRLTFGNR